MRTCSCLHPPYNPESKETHQIGEAIESLRSKGHRIEIIGKPGTVVPEESARCDFAMDCFYADLPLAGVATEAAFRGKSAVVGVTTPRRSIVAWIPPNRYCDPDATEQALMNEHLKGKQNRRFLVRSLLNVEHRCEELL
jgi:hypothetical protein